MPKLIVTARELRYGGKTLKRDEEFEATDKHARALKIVGKAVDAPELAPVRKVATVQPPQPEAEAPEPVEVATPEEDAPVAALSTDDAPIRRGRYGTRRLKSED
jgi:hypothetical protein